MKTRALVLIGVLIIALAAMAMPVMAATDTTTVTGNPQAYASISLATTGSELAISTLSANGASTQSSTMTVVANGASTIAVADTGTSPYAGYMVNCSKAGSTWTTISNANQHLASKMTVTGTAAGAFSTTGVNDLTAGGTLYTGSTGTGAAGQSLGMTYHQSTTYDDIRLDDTNFQYKIPLTWTITVL